VASALSGAVNRRLSSRAGTALFLGLGLLVIFAGRWHSFFEKGPLNNDEGCLLAEAITALHNPIPWLEFDPNTSGPLNVYVLMLPAIFGLHLSYISTRAIAVLLEFGAVAACYAFLRVGLDTAVARLAVVAPVGFWAFATDREFIHYSSERFSIFMAAAALACIAWATRAARPALPLVCAGLLVGALPFAKLQSAPIAVTLGLLALVVALAIAGTLRARLARAGVICGASLAVPAAIVGATLAGGSFHEFWISYIRLSLAYILYDYQPLSYLTSLPEFGRYFDMLSVVLILATLVAAFIAMTRRRIDRRTLTLVVALVVLGAALDAVLAPKRGTWHYLLFAVVPLAGAAAAAVGAALATVPQRFAGVALAAATLVFAATVPATSLLGAYPYVGSVADYYSHAPDPVDALIAPYVHPGERLAIWGWRPQYFIDNYALMGTRDANTNDEVSANFNPYLAYFRRRYIADMEKNRPVGFLDIGSESFDFSGGDNGSIAIFPELAGLIRRDYRLVGSYKHTRFYVRRP
jgi:hypothetical protein